MSLIIVKNGNTTIDLTKYIIKSSYSINLEDIYQEWTDASQVLHRDYKRSRIHGRINVRFPIYNEDYANFISLLQASKSVNSNKVLLSSVFVVNINETLANKLVYFDFDASVNKALASGRWIDEFSINIQEA